MSAAIWKLQFSGLYVIDKDSPQKSSSIKHSQGPFFLISLSMVFSFFGCECNAGCCILACCSKVYPAGNLCFHAVKDAYDRPAAYAVTVPEPVIIHHVLDIVYCIFRTDVILCHRSSFRAASSAPPLSCMVFGMHNLFSKTTIWSCMRACRTARPACG